jgi:Transcriptional regulator/sugar kinase
MNYLGIDLGGTNIAVGLVSSEGAIIGRGHRPCPRGGEAIAAAIVAACREAVADAGLTPADVTAAGLGSPGLLDAQAGVVLFAGNLELEDAPLCGMISAELGVPVSLGNDANVAALGEFLFGAGAGTRNMIAITLGTGVGCGLVLDGKLYAGFNSFAGEVGHIFTVMNGRLCTCGRRGCLETYASATGLMTTARECAEKHPDSALYALTDGAPDKLNGKLFFQALADGDAAAEEAFAHYIDHLAHGLGTVVNLLQPEVICIGGGIAGAGEVLFAPLRAQVQALDFAGNSGNTVRIVGAQLGNDAGIIGAAMLPTR